MSRSVRRFIRVVAAQALAAGLAAALDNLGLLELPALLVPIVGAAINALGKWVRDKLGLELTP